MTYRPTVSEAEEQRIRAWHDAAYESMRAGGEQVVEHIGHSFVVPPQVFPPALMSELLGRAVLDEVRKGDRVLDMGTGCGVNAILAATKATDVLGVDINPHAVEAAVANAARNDVADRVTFRESDVFGAVDGVFDLMIFDPPFRWFTPRDHLEASMADENYAALTRFLTEAPEYLAPGGRVLMFFGTSGDLDYLYRTAADNGFTREPVASRDLTRGDTTVSYFAFRLTAG
ncbi:MAG: methyltransferase [Actinophytocola sp.]|uniref:methyltransferase n=1 Tax=Actinophytocola sp. TaxID=1872138 RepID=UPI001321219B|nr:methyltransferase [Actinophytocola sp.]MPZ85479.1 methyltransferase [Actinophytocola sp.]